jgi:hypothetical protein
MNIGSKGTQLNLTGDTIRAFRRAQVHDNKLMAGNHRRRQGGSKRAPSKPMANIAVIGYGPHRFDSNARSRLEPCA